VSRVEDLRLLTGRGNFTDDTRPEGAAAACFLRSPHAHASITALYITAARAAPGVLAVLLAGDIATNDISRPMPVAGLVVPPWPALADGRVLHVGQPIALVVAETLPQAQDAAELIAIEFATLPAAVEPRAALAPGAAQLWPQAPGNLACDWQGFADPQVAEILASAPHVVHLGLAQSRIAGAPMEPRNATAWIAENGRPVLRAASQGARFLRDALAGITGADLRVLTSDVGGAFGLKTPPYPEHVALLAAAAMTGRAVHWQATRSEAFASDTQAREGFAEARLALDEAGRFLALDVQSVVALGAFLSTAGAHIATSNFARCLGSLYRIPHIAARVRLAFTNTVPTGPYRGAGRPEANHLMERLVEAAARQTCHDALALRRLNMLPPAAMPYSSPVNTCIDSGDFAGLLDAALRHADVAGFPARRALAESQRRARGLGISCFLEHSGGMPIEGAALRLTPQGAVLRMALHGSGQGHETVFARLAAERLGLAPDDVQVVQGDSDFALGGSAAVASRGTATAGSAVVEVAAEVLRKGQALAAQRLEAAEADLVFADGAYCVAGTDRKVTLLALAEDGALDSQGMTRTAETYPNGCHIAEVEIDRDTGLVTLVAYTATDDCGVVLDHHLADAQVMGGAAQGIGQALFERIAYDSEGQLLSASFMDYALPRAADLPGFACHSAPTPCRTNALGVKGVGEAGATAAPAAIMNAIADALPAGAALQLPATAEAVWRALQAGGGLGD